MEKIDLTKYTYSLGTSLTVEALKAHPECVHKVYLSSKVIKNKQLEILINLCEDNRIEYQYDDIFIEKYSLKENCYCIGIIKKFSFELTKDNHIILDGFEDIGQLGTVFRSAVSFNFKNIILINTNVDIMDPRVVRASMGAIFHLHIKKYSSINEYLNDYHYSIYSYSKNNGIELKKISIQNPFSIYISQNNCSFGTQFILKHKNDIEPSISAVSSIVFYYFYKNLLR